LVTFFMSGCASIIDGTSQEIFVTTSPEDAKCTFHRENVVIGKIESTPGFVTVQKSKEDIEIKCTRTGFKEVSFYNDSEIEGATWGNILIGGGIGWAIDSARGADNKYTETVSVIFTPITPTSTTTESVTPTPAGQGQSQSGSSSVTIGPAPSSQ
jgi:hypothetical protein